MNKQTIRSISKQAQQGFTLIELIVVIVILGILAATALPKFADLSGDARYAALNAAGGALRSTVATIHGQSLLLPGATSITVEGVTVTLANGYPDQGANTAAAAGLLATDWVIVPAGTAADTLNGHNPATTATQFAIFPLGLSGNAKADTCYVLYTAAPANGAPSIAVNGSVANCH